MCAKVDGREGKLVYVFRKGMVYVEYMACCGVHWILSTAAATTVDTRVVADDNCIVNVSGQAFLVVFVVRLAGSLVGALLMAVCSDVSRLRMYVRETNYLPHGTGTG